MRKRCFAQTAFVRFWYSPALNVRSKARAVFPVSVLLQRICPERRAFTENVKGGKPDENRQPAVQGFP